MICVQGDRPSTWAQLRRGRDVLPPLCVLLLLVCLDASAGAAAKGCAKAPASSRVVNVRDKGAKADGQADDTAAIQSAIDQVAGTGGTVLVPDGTYMVDAVGERQLKLKSNMTLKLSSGATLKAIPTSQQSYSVLTIAGASNVTVTGGTLEGDRDDHRGTVGEWGMGIFITGGAKNITVSGVTSKKMWGDGFYVQAASDVTFCSVTADYNRRQGLSVIEVERLLVTDSVFKNTRGTRPSAGIDLEPDNPEQKVSDVRIHGSKFLDNAGAGVLVSGKKGHPSIISNVEITQNVFTGIMPIKIEYAPEVLDSAICRNRQIVPKTEASGRLSAYADSSELVVVQNVCGDRRLMLRR